MTAPAPWAMTDRERARLARRRRRHTTVRDQSEAWIDALCARLDRDDHASLIRCDRLDESAVRVDTTRVGIL